MDLADASPILYPVEEPVNFFLKRKILNSAVSIRINTEFLYERKSIEQENCQMTNFKILISGLMNFRHIGMNKNSYQFLKCGLHRKVIQLGRAKATVLLEQC